MHIKKGIILKINKIIIAVFGVFLVQNAVLAYDCEMGKYWSEIDGECKSCPAGKTTYAVGAESENDCKPIKFKSGSSTWNWPGGVVTQGEIQNVSLN